MARIEIDWLTDSYDCELCGSHYAEGANVTIDGKLALQFKPNAHCLYPKEYDRDFVLARILEHLGHEVITADESDR